MSAKKLNWEQGGGFGESLEHAARAPAEEVMKVDEVLGMQSISIRVPKQLISAYKMIAEHHGIGYQPLMRDILQRWVKEGMSEVMAAQSQKAAEADDRLKAMKSSPAKEPAIKPMKEKKAA